jgi:hypothetical protein
MQWNSYKVREYNGQVFGMKSQSFQAYEDLPKRLPGESFELVVDGSAELIARLEGLGWRTRNSVHVTRTPWTYQQYIGQSKGEWSVAKHGYVACNSGWFSERSLSYLATGPAGAGAGYGLYPACSKRGKGFSLLPPRKKPWRRCGK